MAEKILDVQLYTAKEAAGKLNITERTIVSYFRKGKIKGVKLKNRWHVSEENIKKYLNGE